MIVSRGNETLKAIRRLKRRQGDHALLEGPHLLAEALAAGCHLESVLAAPEFAASGPGRALLPRLPRPPLLVSRELLDELADADSPRGVLALARLPRGGAESLPADAGALYLYLDGVQDPGNLGAVARVAEAFGARALALAPGCVHANHARALRASAGSLLRLPVALDVSLGALDERLAPARATWAALAPRGGWELGTGSGRRPLVLALGAEGAGLSAAVEQRADLRWTIPIAPGVESLNVAVAAGIALYAVSSSATRP